MIFNNFTNLIGYTLGLIFIVYSGISFGAKTEVLHQLKATQNIEVASQQVTKAYFYIQHNIRVDEARKELNRGITILEKNLNIVNSRLEDKGYHDLLLLLNFTYYELKDTANRPFNKERGAMMLDYSETLLDGVRSISQEYTVSDNNKERMLIVTENMSFLLERITKYYIAFREGFDGSENVEKLQQSIQQFEAGLQKLRSFVYPSELKSTVKKLTKYWPLAKGFYLGVEKNELPLVVYISTQHMEKSLLKLERFHDKSL